MVQGAVVRACLLSFIGFTSALLPGLSRADEPGAPYRPALLGDATGSRLAVEHLSTCLEFPCQITYPGGSVSVNATVMALDARRVSFVAAISSAGRAAATTTVSLVAESPSLAHPEGGLRFAADVERYIGNPWGLPAERISLNEVVPQKWGSVGGWQAQAIAINPGAISTIAMTVTGNLTGWNYMHRQPDQTTRPMCEDATFGGLGCDGPTSFPLGIPVSVSPQIARCCIQHDVEARGGKPMTGQHIIAMNAEFIACLSTAGLTGALGAPINVAAGVTISALQYFFGIGSSHGANAECFCEWLIPEDVVEAILDPRNGQSKNTIRESQCCDPSTEQCRIGASCDVGLVTTDLETYTDTEHQWEGTCTKVQ